MKLNNIIITCATLLVIMFLTGCETQEERNNRIKNENINMIQNEYIDVDISDNVKDWIVESKIENVITILCLSTSNKCSEIKSNYEDIKKEYIINIEYVELDKINDADKNVYKSTYKIDDYASYVPYIFIVNKGKLISTKNDIYKNEDLINYFKENKLITNK